MERRRYLALVLALAGGCSAADRDPNGSASPPPATGATATQSSPSQSPSPNTAPSTEGTCTPDTSWKQDIEELSLVNNDNRSRSVSITVRALNEPDQSAVTRTLEASPGGRASVAVPLLEDQGRYRVEASLPSGARTAENVSVSGGRAKYTVRVRVAPRSTDANDGTPIDVMRLHVDPPEKTCP